MYMHVHMQHTLRSLMSSDTMEAGLVRLKQTIIFLACCSMTLILPDTQVRRARKLRVERMFWGQVQRALHRSSVSFKCSSPYWKRKHSYVILRETGIACTQVHNKALRIMTSYWPIRKRVHVHACRATEHFTSTPFARVTTSTCTCCTCS
jgi:hypothetical protein